MRQVKKMLLLLLIVAVFAVGCDGQVGGISQEEANQIGLAGFMSLMHTIIYVEDNSLDAQVLGLDIISEAPDELTITWTNFDLGQSIQELIANVNVDRDIADNLDDFIIPGQLVVSGSAHAEFNSGTVDAELTVKFNNFPLEGYPNGSYSVVIQLRNLGDDDDEQINIKVNGVNVNMNSN